MPITRGRPQRRAKSAQAHADASLREPTHVTTENKRRRTENVENDELAPKRGRGRPRQTASPSKPVAVAQSGGNVQPNRPKRGRPARGTPADSSQTKKSGTPDPKPKRGAPRKDGPKDFFTSKAVKSRKKPEAEVAVHLQLVPEERLRSILAQMPVRHHVERANLRHRHEGQYNHWKAQLRAGFNLLFHGFGSKKELLEHFAQQALTDGSVVVANGYFPNLQMKEIAHSILSTLGVGVGFEEEFRGYNLQQLLARLRQAASEACERRCYLIVNNIDGVSLRSLEAQSVLADLASTGLVHLVASIDHVNAPLLWDKKLLARFEWLWHDGSTFAPYAMETAHLNPLLSGMTEERQMRGAGNVLRTLTSNSRAIFRVLAEMQSQLEDDSGVLFSKLYLRCREEFLASSELTLKGHLTEFCDHQLARSKRGTDGQESLFIPMGHESVKLLLSELDVNSTEI